MTKKCTHKQRRNIYIAVVVVVFLLGGALFLEASGLGQFLKLSPVSLTGSTACYDALVCSSPLSIDKCKQPTKNYNIFLSDKECRSLPWDRITNRSFKNCDNVGPRAYERLKGAVIRDCITELDDSINKNHMPGLVNVSMCEQGRIPSRLVDQKITDTFDEKTDGVNFCHAYCAAIVRCEFPI